MVYACVVKGNPCRDLKEMVISCGLVHLGFPVDTTVVHNEGTPNYELKTFLIIKRFLLFKFCIKVFFISKITVYTTKPFIK